MDKYKYIFNGIYTLQDAKYFHKKLENNISNQSYNIIGKLLLSKKYNQTMYDYESFTKLLKQISQCKYREDAEEIYYGTCNKYDKCQLNTLMRLILNKPTKPIFIGKTYIKKQCPHCSIFICGTLSSKYMICGYSGNSYNWDGCGNDWCFKCEKKLCKNWFRNNLFVYENRIHNEHCCKFYAKLNNLNYDDFCNCENI